MTKRDDRAFPGIALDGPHPPNGWARAAESPGLTAAEYAATLFALRDQISARTWQPIETAPMDGTRFLAIRELEVFDEDSGDRSTVREQCIAQVIFGMTYSIPAFAHPIGARITQWMPLPEPPQ